MRKIINSTYVTLDGVVENPHMWPSLPLGGADEHMEVQSALLEQCDIMLMGRRTYDVFAPAWISRAGDPFADRMNAMRKVVASTTLSDPDWNNTEVVADALVDRVQKLKAEDGGHILQFGFGAVTQLLMAHDLLDELHLWIFPQFVEATTADLLFKPDLSATFALDGSQVLSNDIIVARYSLNPVTS